MKICQEMSDFELHIESVLFRLFDICLSSNEIRKREDRTGKTRYNDNNEKSNAIKNIEITR